LARRSLLRCVLSRAIQLLVGLGLLIGALLLALYGLFALLYGGDSRSSGNTYVKLFGSEIDALVGGVALAIALFLVLISVPLMRG
jgi:hypothetical protein